MTLEYDFTETQGAMAYAPLPDDAFLPADGENEKTLYTCRECGEKAISGLQIKHRNDCEWASSKYEVVIGDSPEIVSFVSAYDLVDGQPVRRGEFKYRRLVSTKRRYSSLTARER